MNSTEYLQASSRTLSDQFHGDLVSEYELAAIISDVTAACGRLDKLKKALFYGKKYQSGFQAANRAHGFAPCADELHALMGMFTETAELVEVIFNSEEVDETKVLDEIGDLLWYVALLLRTFDLTFEEAMEKNISKLTARFPDKFTSDAAVNRNEAAEREIFTNHQ